MLALLRLLDESLSLLDNPRGVGLSSTRRDKDLATLKMHEYQDIEVDDAARYKQVRPALSRQKADGGQDWSEDGPAFLTASRSDHRDDAGLGGFIQLGPGVDDRL